MFGHFLIISKALKALKELLWSPSTPYKGLICGISSKSYDWDSSDSNGKIHNPTPSPHMRLWSQVSGLNLVFEVSASNFHRAGK